MSQSLEAATGQPVAPAEQELATGSAHGGSCTRSKAAFSLLEQDQEARLAQGLEPSPQVAVAPPGMEVSVSLSFFFFSSSLSLCREGLVGGLQRSPL